MDAFAIPRRIRPLNSLLANQIAAGEVVERPASVVKELLENSLDAGARTILIEVEQGGSTLIRVRDDGCGICRDDLPLALAPHATSKVYTQQELMQVRSLGFRGEALASIASVSRLTLESRTHEDGHGWGVMESAAPVPSAHPPGTTVEVRELFFNTPARRKFLRSDRTEFEHVAEVVRRIALSRFDITLTLRHNQRQVLQAVAGEGMQRRRLEAICGRPFMQQALSLDYAAAGLRLWGWVVPAAAARPQADLQYFYINGRVIRDRVVTHALRLAYGDQLFPGRHPAYVLYLELDAAQVDVNVHPTKHEVRFREARLVHDFLLRALREALAGKPEAALEERLPAVAEPRAAYRPVPVETGMVAGEEGERLLGLLHGRYLVVECAAGLRLVDVLAARQALMVERIHAAFATEGGLRGQPLLLPLTLNLTGGQMAGLERAGDEAYRFGFEIDRLGPQQVVVRQIPALLRGSDIAALVTTWLEAMAGGDAQARGLQALATQVPAMVPERTEWPALAMASGQGIAAELSLAQLAALLESMGP